MIRYRVLMLAGWAVLVGGPAAAWAWLGPRGDAVAYGGGVGRWVGAGLALVPSALAAALLLLNGALRAGARAGRGELALGTADRALVAAGRVGGWACAAVGGVGLAAAMVAGGPLGIIFGLGLVFVAFSLVGRGRTPDPSARVNAGRPRDLDDPRR